MLPFFRQLRKRLLTENRVRNYMLYAVGEITLVVFGILIALWVNDWSEDRKEGERRDKLLNALSVEFNANLVQLDSVMLFNDRVLDASLKLIRLEPEAALSIPSDTLRDWLQNTSWLWTFNPQNGALRSGISSGDIHLIKSDSLINLLFSWQDVVADAGENEERHIDSQLSSPSVIAPYVRSTDFYRITYPKMVKSKFPSDYPGLVRDPIFEDYLSEVYGHTRDAKNELQLVRKQNLKILQLVDRELGRAN
ncbi:DUF6090 family protein [Robiginitalea sp. SC105]|uniref:DUF6090 family protein n=1 Tax=Robiginitalea sp. SC105 TaxID=2762332 RepID=UPI00163A1248|nr:DUF6090 family protein [Robiginitalea sp. SC105]MBC2840063.1 hypothetical protein [Robiginitalea sp. SC105]